MLQGPAGTVLATFLALALGAGQSVCACLSATPASIDSSGHHGAHGAMDQVSHGDMDGCHARHHEDKAPCGSGEGNCRHCMSKQAITAPEISRPAASLAEQLAETLAVTSSWAVVTRDEQAPLARNCGAWRDPPPRTPVSLKIRLTR